MVLATPLVQLANWDKSPEKVERRQNIVYTWYCVLVDLLGHICVPENCSPF